jgi:DNA-binding XRE family transcriptional regulator
MKNMIDRIKQIMEHYQMSPASFAEQIGINRSNLTHLFSGRNQPSLELAKKILHCYPEIKTEWLIMGVGEMMRSVEEKELNVKIQNERKNYSEQAEPDLFTVNLSTKNAVMDNAPENAVDVVKKNNEQISDSPRDIEKPELSPIIPHQVEKEAPLSHPALPSVKKIVFFYSDNSFEVFHPKNYTSK